MVMPGAHELAGNPAKVGGGAGTAAAQVAFACIDASSAAVKA